MITMSNIEFELVFKLDHDENPEIYIDALYQAGCDNAIVAVGVKGYIGLDFTYEENNPQEAIMDVYKKVLKAIPHAKLDRAEPCLLNVTELAYQFNFTKQNMRKYVRNKMTTIDIDFPAPVTSGKTSYWHIAEVANWLSENTDIDISDNRINTYISIWGLNQALENLRFPVADKELTRRFENMLEFVA
jgi:predicted membrane GTPase involved in stress response